jgi:hypothetical protein
MKCEEALSYSSVEVFNLALGQWAMGFFSGLNSEPALKGIYRNLGVFTSEFDISDRIYQICGLNPDNTILLSATEVYQAVEVRSFSDFDDD